MRRSGASRVFQAMRLPIVMFCMVVPGLLAGCGGGSGADDAGDDAPECVTGTAGCPDDAGPGPSVTCDDPSVIAYCDGTVVRRCDDNTTERCDPGVCLTVGQGAVCATAPGSTSCDGSRGDGTRYELVCADGNAVSATDVCDLRTGECVPAAFDCSELASVPAGQIQCDGATGNFYTRCIDGQPLAFACDEDSACSGDGSYNCYTPPVAGSACGGSTVCYPGLHCTQSQPSAATCVQPPGILACSSTDVLSVCVDTDTAYACVNGAVWKWEDLTAWGGSCTSNHVNVPVGGICIPGLADCNLGLACDKSELDIAGTCRVPSANAPAECTLTGQASTGNSCIYDWAACLDGNQYRVECLRQNIAGTLITLCECSVNGTVTESFAGTEACGVTDVGMLDAVTAQKCGWDVTTVGVAP